MNVEGNEVTRVRVNIADLGRVLEVGDRVKFSDDGIETTGSIIEIYSEQRAPFGLTRYTCKVNCENEKVKVASLSSYDLIRN